MEKLTIKIESKDWFFLDSLQEIKSQIDKWFLEWFDKNNNQNYEFNIT